MRLDFRESGDRPSDIDFLFEWAGDVNQSLLRRVAMQQELADYLQRSVDLVDRTEILTSHHAIRRQAILQSALTIYDQRSKYP